MDHPAQPLISTPPRLPPSLPPIRACGECGRSVPESESIVLNNVVVCAGCKPIVVAKLQTGQQIGDGGVWRENKTVVIGPRAVLPSRCVKCNAPTDGSRLKRVLYWHSPLVYLLLLTTMLLIYLIVAIVVRKKATVHVALCAQHRQTRWIHIGVAWAFVLGGFAAIVVGANHSNLAALILFGVVGVITGIIWGILGARVIFARRIDENWIRFGGAGRAFLESLQQFPKPV